MLAAASDRDNSLSVLRVALSTIGSASGSQLSDGLKAHIAHVLHEASVIARDPANVDAHTSPEAIELAVKLLPERALQDDLERIDTFAAISPDVAARVLRVFDPLAVA
jgi:hypothetical protein